MVEQPIGAALNRDLVENRDHIERVEAELDGFITRRARWEAAERAESEAWAESVRAHNAARRAEMRRQWCEYHHDSAKRLRGVLASLIDHHERKAAELSPPTEGV
jgi:hypothetical protein